MLYDLSYRKHLEGNGLCWLPGCPSSSFVPMFNAACSKCMMERGCDGLLCVLLCMFTAFVRCVVPCLALLCCAVLCCAVLCCAVLCCAILCCAVPCRAVPCCAMLCCAMPCCAVPCHALAHCCCWGATTHVMSLSGTGREGRHHPSRPPHAGLAGPLPQAPVSQQDHPAGPVQGCRQRW